MDYFTDKDGQLMAEAVSVAALAEQYGTPCYIYSQATLARHVAAFHAAVAELPHTLCYAVKANSNLTVLRQLARLGMGFDIVSGGELARVLAVDGVVQDTVFSGVGKQADEIRQALQAGVRSINIESVAEIDVIEAQAAALGCRAPVSVRINPDVDPQTHPYIATGLKDSKFGIAWQDAVAVYARLAQSPQLEVVGIACHIGSQIMTVAPFVQALQSVLSIVDALAQRGIVLRDINMGGGLGVRYTDEQPPALADYGQALVAHLQGRALHLILEPGRTIMANAGLLVTQVLYLKAQGEQRYAIVDAGMNDFVRPALYQSVHALVPVQARPDLTEHPYHVVGPVCESSDCFAKATPLRLAPGDYLALRGAGAYGMVMASNYNSRPRPVELLVAGEQVHVIRPRETLADLLASERAHLLDVST